MPELKKLKGGFSILPPSPGHCPVCAGKHSPEMPHNPQSLYWGVVFQDEHGRAPTWKDALAHCTPEIQKAWIEALKEFNIIVEL